MHAIPGFLEETSPKPKPYLKVGKYYSGGEVGYTANVNEVLTALQRGVMRTTDASNAGNDSG